MFTPIQTQKKEISPIGFIHEKFSQGHIIVLHTKGHHRVIFHDCSNHYSLNNKSVIWIKLPFKNSFNYNKKRFELVAGSKIAFYFLEQMGLTTCSCSLKKGATDEQKISHLVKLKTDFLTFNR